MRLMDALRPIAVFVVGLALAAAPVMAPESHPAPGELPTPTQTATGSSAADRLASIEARIAGMEAQLSGDDARKWQAFASAIGGAIIAASGWLNGKRQAPRRVVTCRRKPARP